MTNNVDKFKPQGTDFILVAEQESDIEMCAVVASKLRHANIVCDYPLSYRSVKRQLKRAMQYAPHNIVVINGERASWRDVGTGVRVELDVNDLADAIIDHDCDFDIETNHIRGIVDDFLEKKNAVYHSQCETVILSLSPSKDKSMTKQTTISFIVRTDDQGNRSIAHRVSVNNPDQFSCEDDKEASTVSDINHFFDQIDNGQVNRTQMV